jgi:hypothetical protein
VALESTSAALQAAATPSQLPARSCGPNEKARCLRHTGPETPREGCPWPGVTSARGRARAGSPTARRIASLPYNPGCDADSRRTWTTSVRWMSQADSGPASRPARGLVSLQTRRPERMFARFRWITGRRLVRMRKSGLGATSVLPSRPLKARMPARWPDRSGVAHARPSEAEAARSRLPSLSRPLRPSPASSRSRTRGSLHE